MAQGPELAAMQETRQGPVASTIIFGSNLIPDPCATGNYSDDGGYFVVGRDNCFVPGTTQWLAGAFIAAATGFPSRSRLPIVLRDPSYCPTNTITLSIYTDACYLIGPGTPLVSAIATVPPAPCALAVAKLPNSAPVLTKGTKYWVVATTVGSCTQLAGDTFRCSALHHQPCNPDAALVQQTHRKRQGDQGQNVWRWRDDGRQNKDEHD